MDQLVSYRPGTRFAPEKIIKAFDSYSLYCADKRTSIEKTNLIRLGAVDVDHSFDKTNNNIAEKVGGIPEHICPIILGGDHSITYPIFKGVQKRNKSGKTGLIVFDTHFDFRKPVPGKEHSGNWLYNLNGHIDYSLVTFLGISAPIYSPTYSKRLEELGVLIKTPYELRKQGWGNVINEIMQKMKGCDNIHISVDIDAIDQAFTKATSIPNPSGLFPHEVIDAIYELAQTNKMTSLDIVEISPPFDDKENTTAHIAAHLIMNFIAGNLQKK